MCGFCDARKMHLKGRWESIQLIIEGNGKEGMCVYTHIHVYITKT